PMTKRVLPNTQTALNAAANNGQIDYFPEALSPHIADYYFAKITDASAPSFRGKLLDYYIEAYDGRGNLSRSDIQHVFVEDDGQGSGVIPSLVSFSSDPRDCADLTITYKANGGVLSNLVPVTLYLRFTNSGGFSSYGMTHQGGGTSVYTVAQASIPDNAPLAEVYFQNGATIDNNSGVNWSTTIRNCDSPVGPSSAAFSNAPACEPVTASYYPNAGALQAATQVYAHVGYNGWNEVYAGQVMTKVSNNLWRISITPAQGAGQLDLVFNDGGSIWDNNGGVDWHFTLNVCEPPVPPPGITVTNPPATNISVGAETTHFNLQGLSGNGVSGMMSWTNLLNGESGQLSATPAWIIPNVALATGVNTIVIIGTNSGSSLATNAADSGSEIIYTNGWDDADNGGFGFGWWVFYTSSGDQNQNGRFMANSAAVNIGTPAWGLYANNGQLSEAKRILTNALAVGQTVQVKMDNGYLNVGSGVGVALQNSGGSNLWQFFFNGGDTNYNITGSATDIGWTSSGIDIEFTLVGPTSYISRITPLGGPTRTNRGNMISQADRTVRVFRAWNYNAGAGSDYDVFFNDLRLVTANAGSGSSTSATVSITRESSIQDTNGDGIPDSWCERYGFSPSGPSIAGNDDDDDTVLNRDEYIADTNPTNAASVYDDRILAMDGREVLTFQAGPPTSVQRMYDVYWATNLTADNWTLIGLEQPGYATGNPVYLSVTNEGPRRFYRTGVRIP
ncbi:MAG: hypothetical protein V2A34_10410, partial [Lentisphaerota bacterium]